MSLILTVTIHGDSEEDLCLSLDEVRSKVEDGFNQGFDGNETMSYNFDVREEEK